MKKHKLHLAGCVILDKKGRILLLHRKTSTREQWETPGGKIKEGETVETAAIREVKEELDVRVIIIRKLGHEDFIEDGFTMGYTWLLAGIKTGNQRIVEKDKFDDLRYFSWKELNDIKSDLSPNTHNLVEAYYRGEIEI